MLSKVIERQNIGLGLLGLGVVGSGVVKALLERDVALAKQIGYPLILKTIQIF